MHCLAGSLVPSGGISGCGAPSCLLAAGARWRRGTLGTSSARACGHMSPSGERCGAQDMPSRRANCLKQALLVTLGRSAGRGGVTAVVIRRGLRRVLPFTCEASAPARSAAPNSGCDATLCQCVGLCCPACPQDATWPFTAPTPRNKGRAGTLLDTLSTREAGEHTTKPACVNRASRVPKAARHFDCSAA